MEKISDLVIFDLYLRLSFCMAIIAREAGTFNY
jgi:hypothetical protein